MRSIGPSSGSDSHQRSYGRQKGQRERSKRELPASEAAEKLGKFTREKTGTDNTYYREFTQSQTAQKKSYRRR